MLIAARAVPKRLTSSNARWILSRPNLAWIQRKCVARTFRRPMSFRFTPQPDSITTVAITKLRLNKAQEIAGYAKLREEQKKARDEGRLIGIGVSTYVEICALGPSQAMPAGGWESATVRIEPTGKVTVLTGASPHGQGQETSFAQIAADELGVNLNDVTVIHGDTGIVQYGIGTFGSRATAVGGTAVLIAIQKLKEKAHKIAAHMLQADATRVSFEGGKYSLSRPRQPRRRRERSEPVVPVGEAPPVLCPNRRPKASRVCRFRTLRSLRTSRRNLPPDTEPGLSATYFFEPKNFTFPFGTHIAVVEVDRETGDIKFLRYVAVDDCGKVINPMLVDGQVHGGIVQSIGQAMYEEVVYDEQGQLVTGTLMDYAVPRASHIPDFELDRTETPSPVNPLGVKGVGEAGTIGATPAIVGAIVDALAPFGVKHLDMPVKPENVWRIINGHQTLGSQINTDQKRSNMIPAQFDYQAPATLEEAVSLLASDPDGAKILAGGHSLIPAMKLRLAQPQLLVDIARIKSLAYIREEGDQILIGATTTHYQLESSDLLKQICPAAA